MSIAFQALVLIILALPGIIFHRFRSRAETLRERRSVADELANSVMAAGILHALWSVVFNAIGKYALGLRVNLNAVMMISMGQFGKDNAGLIESIESITRYPWWVLLYFASIYIGAAIFGQAIGDRCTRASAHSGNVARGFRWLNLWWEGDPNVRRWTEWSEHLDYEGDKLLLQLLATVIPLGNTPFLYVGILDSVVPDDHGHPDRFILRDVCRRKLDEPDFYRVKGDIFIVRASEARTLSILRVGLGFDVETVDDDNATPVS